MVFGQRLAGVLHMNNETQLDAAAAFHVSNSAISKVTLGTRKPSKQLMRSATERYDDAFLTLAAWTETTGEASVPILNNVELNRTSTHVKSIEEIEEALSAIKKSRITKRREQLTPDELEQMKTVVFESLEAITALIHHVAVLCTEYGFSWTGVWKEHRRQLKANQYIL